MAQAGRLFDRFQPIFAGAIRYLHRMGLMVRESECDIEYLMAPAKVQDQTHNLGMKYEAMVGPDSNFYPTPISLIHIGGHGSGEKKIIITSIILRPDFPCCISINKACISFGCNRDCNGRHFWGVHNWERPGRFSLFWAQICTLSIYHTFSL